MNASLKAHLFQFLICLAIYSQPVYRYLLYYSAFLENWFTIIRCIIIHRVSPPQISHYNFLSVSRFIFLFFVFAFLSYPYFIFHKKGHHMNTSFHSYLTVSLICSLPWDSGVIVWCHRWLALIKVDINHTLEIFSTTLECWCQGVFIQTFLGWVICPTAINKGPVSAQLRLSVYRDPSIISI